MSELENTYILIKFLGIAVSWGFSFYLIKVCLESFTPAEITFLRSFLGFLTVLIWCWVWNIKIPKPSSLWVHLGVLSLLLNTFPSYLFSVAESQVSSTLAGLINATTPAITIFIVTVILRNEKISRIQFTGLGVSFAGIGILLEIWNGIGENSIPSVLALFGAVSCFAASYPYIRKYMVGRREAPEALIVVQLGISSVCTLPYVVSSLNWPPKIAFTSLTSIILLGIFASGFAYVWNIEVIAKYGSARSATVSYLIPIVAVIAGFVLLNEVPTIGQIVGGSVILLGMWIQQKDQNKI